MVSHVHIIWPTTEKALRYPTAFCAPKNDEFNHWALHLECLPSSLRDIHVSHTSASRHNLFTYSQIDAKRFRREVISANPCNLKGDVWNNVHVGLHVNATMKNVFIEANGEDRLR